MSLRVYTSPGYISLPLPTVLRRYVPDRVPRQVRYTRSLSSPLGVDKAFTYIPLESGRSRLTNSLLEWKTRGLITPISEIRHRDSSFTALETKRQEFSKPLIPSHRRDYIANRIVEEPKQRNVSNSYVENRRKVLSCTTPLELRSNSILESRPSSRWWHKKEQQLCTPNDLLKIILEPTGQYELPTDPCNEVYPGIILSDGPTALCTSLLKRMGVSHVLNAAQGKERPGQVNTSPSFYSHCGIRYLGVEAFDHIAFRLYPYFDEASEFMEGALDSGGKVLVHCRAGISRSATLVCAFLMLKRHMSAQEAVRTVRKNRSIIPNDGFLQQLSDLNERLQKKR